MRVKQHVTLVPQPPPSAATLSRSLPPASEVNNNHPEQGYSSGLGGGLTKLSYIILDNHISDIEGLHLLGRLVQNIRRPLDYYVPSAATSAAAFTFVHSSTAQGLSPTIDREVFVLPDLRLSHAESNSVTFSQTCSYSAQTKSLLTALLGLSLSSSKNSSRTLTLKAKVIHTMSLTQHGQVFETLMRIHGREIKQAVKSSGGVMFFVIGVKIAKDAVVETREEGGRSIGGNLEVDTASALGIKSASTMRGMGTVVGGHSRLRQWENFSMQEVKGERAFAMEYCSVKLQRKVEFSGRGSRRKVPRDRAERLKDPSTTPGKDEENAMLEDEIEQRQKDSLVRSYRIETAGEQVLADLETTQSLPLPFQPQPRNVHKRCYPGFKSRNGIRSPDDTGGNYTSPVENANDIDDHEDDGNEDEYEISLGNEVFTEIFDSISDL